MLKKMLSHYYYDHVHDSAVGYRLRRLIKKENVPELKPFNGKSSVSDLFVWRCNDEWDTDFELFNITSFIYPKGNVVERCNLIFFNADGARIADKTIELQPFERQTLSLADFLEGHQGVGTLAVFHHSALSHQFEAHQSHLTERGYIGYRRKGDTVKSFCHGNLQSLAQAPNAKNYSYVAGTSQPMRYHPQLILSDCKKAELIYTNPSSRVRPLNIKLFDKSSKLVDEINIAIPPRGVRIVNVDNKDHNIHTFDNSGEIIMWRPVIVKFYDTHFDAMHG